MPQRELKNWFVDIRDKDGHDEIEVMAFDADHAMQEARQHVRMFGGSLYSSSKARPGNPIMSEQERAWQEQHLRELLK